MSEDKKGSSNQSGTPGLQLIDANAIHDRDDKRAEQTGITLELYQESAASVAPAAPTSSALDSVIALDPVGESLQVAAENSISGIELSIGPSSRHSGRSQVDPRPAGEIELSSSTRRKSAAELDPPALPTDTVEGNSDGDEGFNLEGMELPELDGLGEAGGVEGVSLEAFTSLTDEGAPSLGAVESVAAPPTINLQDFGIPVEPPAVGTLSSISVEKTSTASVAPASVGGEDPGLKEQLPYLFNRRGTDVPGGRPFDPAVIAHWMAHPVGDAVVPGGAAQAPDVEVLKKYLMLREQDVAALSVQLQNAHEQVARAEAELREEHANNATLHHLCEEQRRKISDADHARSESEAILKAEIDDLRFQLRAKDDHVRSIEVQMREAIDETERLKERVRTDIRKIRNREKELESRLEMVRRDSEALMGAREVKIVELKRRLDLLEFNMDLLQDQYKKEQEHAHGLKQRLTQVAQAVRVAGGLLDPSGDSQKGSFRKIESLVKDLDGDLADPERSSEGSAA